MNTPTPAPKSGRPLGLLATVALAIAQAYQDNLSIAIPKRKPWSNISSGGHETAIHCMTQAIPQALAQLEVPTFATKAALRSYLSVSFPHAAEAGSTTVIEGFDQLYAELQDLFTLKHSAAVQEANNTIDELRQLLTTQDMHMAAQEQRHQVGASQLRHDFQAAANSYEKEISKLRNQVARAVDLAEKRSVRSRELMVHNDLLQNKIDELVKLPKKEHWDSPTYSTTVADFGNTLDAQKMLLAIKNAPPAARLPQFIVVDFSKPHEQTISGLTTRLDEEFKTTTFLKAQVADRESAIRDINGARQADASRINGLEHALGETANEREHFRHMWEQETLKTAAQAEELAKVKKMNETQIGMIRSRDAIIDSGRVISENRIRNEVSAILKEFKIESPTNSIPDMVRAACESKTWERERVKSQLDRQDKELKELKSKRFGDPIEKVLAFRKEHGGTMSEGVMGQIINHILTQPIEVLPKEDASCHTALDHAAPYTAIPQRIYGAVPRMVGDVSGTDEELQAEVCDACDVMGSTRLPKLAPISRLNGFAQIILLVFLALGISMLISDYMVRHH